MSASSLNFPSDSAICGCLHFPIFTKARRIAKQPHSVNCKGGAVKREEPSMSFFQGSSNVNIQNSNFNQIHGNATIIRYGDGQFTQDQRNWICDFISSNAILPDINDNLNEKFLSQLIINLPRSEAVFNDYQTKKKTGPCFEGTRVVLLREIADWTTGTDESRMYILSGLAGIGKSTVAYTIASRAADLNLLGASFFFSRDDHDRNNAKKFFTTIAHQLCVYDETFSKAIGDVLQTKRGSAATTKDPQEQLKVLILDPLRRIIRSQARPILVVVDALDECVEDDEHAVINGLSQLVRELPWFKVILTTRPKPNIDDLLGCQDGHKLFRLQDIEDKVVDGDIRLYLKHSLSLEQVRKHYTKKQWCASDKEIDSLVDAAGRLFIIASTAVRYILDKYASNPAAQMRKTLRAFARDCTPFKDLDHFYTIILRDVVPVECDSGEIVNRYQSVVGAIIFVEEYLSVSTLAHLINIETEEIRAVLDRLQSVILLDEDDVPLIYHKSFSDYVTDRAHCKDPHLRIDPEVLHTQIVTCCFEIANKHLRYNILDLSETARYMSNGDALDEDGITHNQQKEKIPEQLYYACTYWADHLEDARIDNPDLINGLSKFLDEHTLHCFEVLSLVGNLDLAPHALRVALKFLESSSSYLQQLISDALRFISRFYELIERSALHTYYSALLFSPTDSLLHRFIKEVEHNIFVIRGGPENWDALVACPSHEHGVQAIKFSRDSTLFYSCSEEAYFKYGELKIWDAATGIPISSIPGQKFAVTNDFSTIASLSEDNIITYYDTDGSERGTMFTTSMEIEELALSSESNRVAASLYDGSVFLWESRNRKLIGGFEGQGGVGRRYRVRLQFSSTGTRLVYSSWKSSVMKLRDGINGRFIADLQCGPRHKFVFSDDGTRIASLSRQHRRLSLWNSESGALISDTRYYENFETGSNLAISATGSLLATAGKDYVRLWSEDRGHLVPIEVLGIELTFSMAFSLDNMLAIGTQYSTTQLYNVKTSSFISRWLPLNGSHATVAFSSDCTRFAYGGHSDDMYLWNFQDIDVSDTPQKEPTYILAIALSRDCSRLACWDVFSSVDLWRTSPIMQRIASYPYHRAQSPAMGFAPDGMLFVSGPYDGTIKLWNSEDGSLRGTLNAPSELTAVALSNSVLAAAGKGDVILWSLDTLSLIHAFQSSSRYLASTMSISDDSDIVAVGFECIYLFDVVNRTKITVFTVYDRIDKLTFLPDKSHLVAQCYDGRFLSFNLIDKSITRGPVLEHLIQLPDIPLWHGVPIWHCQAEDEDQHKFSALFSQHKSPVPVLWIPNNLRLVAWAQGSSMIALGCVAIGHVILLRLPTSQVG